METKDSNDARGLLDEIEDRLARGVEEFRAYMASPEGRHLRQRVAQVLIIGAPFILRSRFIAKTWPGRVIALFGGAALVVKLAETLRDWEPEPGIPPVPD